MEEEPKRFGDDQEIAIDNEAKPPNPVNFVKPFTVRLHRLKRV